MISVFAVRSYHEQAAHTFQTGIPHVRWGVDDTVPQYVHVVGELTLPLQWSIEFCFAKTAQVEACAGEYNGAPSLGDLLYDIDLLTSNHQDSTFSLPSRCTSRAGGPWSGGTSS